MESVSYVEDDRERRLITWTLKEYYLDHPDEAIRIYIDNLEDVDVTITIVEDSYHCELIKKSFKYIVSNSDKYSLNDMCHFGNSVPLFPTWLTDIICC